MSNQAGLHREQIKAEIRIKFGSMSAFEDKKGLPRGSAKDVLRGRSVARTAQAIAEVMGKPVHELFPGAESTKADDTPPAKSPHRLNKAAA